MSEKRYKIEARNRVGLPNVLVNPDGVTIMFDKQYSLDMMAQLFNEETTPLYATIEAQAQELARLREAIESARQAMGNQTHGNAQYQPDILEADSILRDALKPYTEESDHDA